MLRSAKQKRKKLKHLLEHSKQVDVPQSTQLTPLPLRRTAPPGFADSVRRCCPYTPNPTPAILFSYTINSPPVLLVFFLYIPHLSPFLLLCLLLILYLFVLLLIHPTSSSSFSSSPPSSFSPSSSPSSPSSSPSSTSSPPSSSSSSPPSSYSYPTSSFSSSSSSNYRCRWERRLVAVGFRSVRPLPPDLLRGRIVTLVPFLGRFRNQVDCILSFTATFYDSLTSYLARNAKATRSLDLTATATACSVPTWWAIEYLHIQRWSLQNRHLRGALLHGECLLHLDAVFRLSLTKAFRSSPLGAKVQLENALGALFSLRVHLYPCLAGPYTRHDTKAACVALLQSLWSTRRFCTRTNNGV